jgi:23S rRNA pseudouridine1911/1915/1917 synthase
MSDPLRLHAEVPPEMVGRRLDQALSELFPEYSRSRLKKWVEEGHVQVNGGVLRPKDKLAGGEVIVLDVVVEEDRRFAAEPIPLRIIYEDAELLVIDKPAGLVVHPAAGNWQGTLLNALLHHAPELAGVPRAGIVHRLDKDTSGLLVVASTLEAQSALVEQLQARSMSREYQAVTVRVMTAGGTVDAPIDRHPVDRKRMAVVAHGREAITHYRVLERFRAHTHITVKLETGRTHQIRLHMAHINFPLVGDPVYGGRLRLPAGVSEELRQCLQQFPRQALHAARLGLDHPRTGEALSWSAPLPEDMQQLLVLLRQDAAHG